MDSWVMPVLIPDYQICCWCFCLESLTTTSFPCAGVSAVCEDHTNVCLAVCVVIEKLWSVVSPNVRILYKPRFLYMTVYILGKCSYWSIPQLCPFPCFTKLALDEQHTWKSLISQLLQNKTEFQWHLKPYNIYSSINFWESVRTFSEIILEMFIAKLQKGGKKEAEPEQREGDERVQRFQPLVG